MIFMTKPKSLHITAILSPPLDEWDVAFDVRSVRLLVEEDGKKIYSRRLLVSDAALHFALANLCEQMNLKRLEDAIDQL